VLICALARCGACQEPPVPRGEGFGRWVMTPVGASRRWWAEVVTVGRRLDACRRRASRAGLRRPCGWRLRPAGDDFGPLVTTYFSLPADATRHRRTELVTRGVLISALAQSLAVPGAAGARGWPASARGWRVRSAG